MIKRLRTPWSDYDVEEPTEEQITEVRTTLCGTPDSVSYREIGLVNTEIPRLNLWLIVSLPDGRPAIVAAMHRVPGRPWEGFYEVYSPFLDFSCGPHIFHDSELKVP